MDTLVTASERVANMQPIVFFDGVCNLCNNSVDFIIRRDKKATFLFATLQSESASKLLSSYHFDTGDLTTLVLLKEGKLYTQSRAALEICRRLNGLWPILYVFRLVPAFLRDAIYNWVSRNRYGWFGRRDSCRLPQPHEKMRFLSDEPLNTTSVS